MRFIHIADVHLGAVPDKEFHKVAVVSQYPEILDMAKRYGFIPVLNSAPEEGVSLTIRLGLDALGKVDGAMFMVDMAHIAITAKIIT